MTDNRTGDEQQRANSPLSVSRYVLTALQLAVIGSAGLALFESLSAALVCAKHFEGGTWPLRLIAAALGKAVITHALLWTPLLCISALVVYRIRGRRLGAAPLPPLFGIFALLVAVTVVPAGLDLGTKWERPVIVAASGIVAVVGLLLALLVRVIVSRVSERKLQRAMWFVALPSAFLAAGSVVAFVGSPFANPGGYRAPTGTPLASKQDRPHVLWIVMDTVRADRTSYHGYDRRTTPFLESWAERSIVFDNVIGNGMWTVPSHASMFTGASVRRHGLGPDNTVLDDTFQTVAETLSNEGYVTASFSNNPWISRNSKLTKGFDTAHVIYHLRHLSRSSLEFAIESWGIEPPLPWLDRDFGGALTNHMITRWLDTFGKGKAPLFLFVNYMEAHLPYIVPKHFQQTFMTDDQVERSYELRKHAFGPIAEIMAKRFNIEGVNFLSQYDREVLKREYEAGISYVDHRVRELIDMFRQRGLLENTLVVIVSDHGEHLDTHGLWAHRFLAYNDLTHVTLMLHVPDRHGSLRIETPVQPSDLYTTVLNYALGRSERGSPYESRDLFDVASRGGEPRIAITECGGPDRKLRERIKKHNTPAVSHLATPQITAQDGQFKYMVSGDGQKELFDLTADPGELHNVIAEHPAEVDRLASYIREWMLAVPSFEPTDPDTKEDMDPDFLEALRSLGYLGD